MLKIRFIGAIALALFSCSSKAGTAQPAVPDSKPVPPTQYEPPPLPSSGTPVGRRRGAAGRGNCEANLPLTALVPTTEQTAANRKATYIWTNTIAEYPTFWFYLPDAQPDLSLVEFVLQDERDNDVYRTQVSLPSQPGIISVRLPATASPLRIDQKYHWFLKTAATNNCMSSSSNLAKDSVEGWVQRVTPNPTLLSQLKSATPQQQVSLYATNGFWYEALTQLAELRSLKPADAMLQADWNRLLQSVGLADVASQPLVQCCKPES